MLYQLSYAAMQERILNWRKYTNRSISCQLKKLDPQAHKPLQSRRMIHIAELKTRSYECDSYGHINNATYLNYLEYARIQLLEQLPVPYQKLRRRGVGFVVTRISIDYRRQVRSGESLRIETRPILKQKVRMTFQQNIYRDDQLVAEAQVSWACINEQGKLIPIPPELDIPEMEPDPEAEGQG